MICPLKFYLLKWSWSAHTWNSLFSNFTGPTYILIETHIHHLNDGRAVREDWDFEKSRQANCLSGWYKEVLHMSNFPIYNVWLKDFEWTWKPQGARWNLKPVNITGLFSLFCLQTIIAVYSILEAILLSYLTFKVLSSNSPY